MQSSYLDNTGIAQGEVSNEAAPAKGRSHGYWAVWENLADELRAIVRQSGDGQRLPTKGELLCANRGDLCYAIKRHGGFALVAGRLGLALGSGGKERGYWDSWDTVLVELRAWIVQYGTPGVMPTQRQLILSGRSDLLSALQRYGSAARARTDLGLQPAVAHKANGYWKAWSNLVDELERFCADHGTSGVMPSLTELHRYARSDIVQAIQTYHDGFAAVTTRLGWHSAEQGPPLEQGVLHGIHTTITALQPLLDAQLLSRAHVLLLLRRIRALHGEHPLLAQVRRAWKNEDSEPLDALRALSANCSTSVPSTAPTTATTKENALGDEWAVMMAQLAQLDIIIDDTFIQLTTRMAWQFAHAQVDVQQCADARRAGQLMWTHVDCALTPYQDVPLLQATWHCWQAEWGRACALLERLSGLAWGGPPLRFDQAHAAAAMLQALRGTNAGDARYFLNADDPGLGKTATTLAALRIAGVRRVVVVAPFTVANDVWFSVESDVRRCWPEARVVRGVVQTIAALQNTEEGEELPCICVLHYDELRKHQFPTLWGDAPWDVVVFDEVHTVKQRRGMRASQRRRGALRLRAHARAAFGLTGTALINEVREPLSILTLLRGEEENEQGKAQGCGDDPLLVFEQLLGCSVRRRKSELLATLPPCSLRVEAVSLPPSLRDAMAKVHRAMDLPPGAALHQLRCLAVQAKLPLIVARAQAVPKLLVLTYHTSGITPLIMDALHAVGLGVVVITGQTSSDERATVLAQFRDGEGARVLLGTIGTIGEGLTLFDGCSSSTASEIVLADLPYTWAAVFQGIGRLHRPGQRKAVQVTVPMTTYGEVPNGAYPDTIDERIWELVFAKRSLAALALDGDDGQGVQEHVVRAQLQRWVRPHAAPTTHHHTARLRKGRAT